MDFLLSCLEDYSRPNYMYTPIIIPCLQLLINWLRVCNDETAAHLLRTGKSTLQCAPHCAIVWLLALLAHHRFSSIQIRSDPSQSKH